MLDFVCIHPFRDGNGRVSRLLTTLLLQNEGFAVARYVSLERLIEDSKQDYYRILELCSTGWREGANELVPWWNCFLSTLRLAYREFERQVTAADAGAGKGDLVRRVVAAQIGPFSLAELRAQCPAVSVQLIKKVLAEMKREGGIALAGRGRDARWTAR